MEMCAYRNQMPLSARESSLFADHSTVNSFSTSCATEAVCQVICAKREEYRIDKEARSVDAVVLKGYDRDCVLRKTNPLAELPLRAQRPSFRLVHVNDRCARHWARVGIASLLQLSLQPCIVSV
jgi:hypothetical protein